MIKGIDISNNNWSYLASHDFAPLRDPDRFVMMKASEGVTYKDRCLDLYCTILNNSFPDGRPIRDRLYGFYHFARPENNNDPVAEALNFWRCVSAHAGHAVFALDVEGGALTLSKAALDKWVMEWLTTIRDISGGVKPLIYCSAAQTDQFPTAASNDFGLWVAKWSAKKPTKAEIKPWALWAMWQDSNGGGVLDTDYFNGSPDQFRKYAAR